MAISGGTNHVLALECDGTVVGWGTFYWGVPPELADVVAISAGATFDLALKADGSVVAWGSENAASGETDVPAGLGDVVAISAGFWHGLALRSDGTVVAWGNNVLGQATVPAGLEGVIAIEAGGFDSLALVEERPQRLLLEQLEEAVTGVGPGTSLVDKLRNARAALAAHDLTAASRILNAFGNQVRAQAGKSIPKDTATTLISTTTKITNMLSC